MDTPLTLPPGNGQRRVEVQEPLRDVRRALTRASYLPRTCPSTVESSRLGDVRGHRSRNQAAWIYEKLQSKTDNHGLAEDAISIDTILDTVSLYWFTNTAASSARIYWENRSATMSRPTLTLPVAVTVFPKDIPLLPRTWIEAKYTNLIHYTVADRGGHFAALEQPERLVDELRSGLRPLRHHLIAHTSSLQ